MLSTTKSEATTKTTAGVLPEIVISTTTSGVPPTTTGVSLIQVKTNNSTSMSEYERNSIHRSNQSRANMEKAREAKRFKMDYERKVRQELEKRQKEEFEKAIREKQMSKIKPPPTQSTVVIDLSTTGNDFPIHSTEELEQEKNINT